MTQIVEEEEVSDILKNDVTQLPDDHLNDFLSFGSQTFVEIANKNNFRRYYQLYYSHKSFQMISSNVSCFGLEFCFCYFVLY